MQKGNYSLTFKSAVFALLLGCNTVFAYEGPAIAIPSASGPMVAGPNMGTGPNMQFCFEPYIGLNGAMRRMSWPNHFGGNIFKKQYPEGDLYLGSWFTEHLGLQVGYKTTVTRTQYANLANTLSLGLPVSTTPPEVHLTQARFRGWHAEIIGYIPLMMPNCTFLYGTIGFTRFKLYQSDKIVQTGANGGLAFTVDQLLTTFNNTKTILSLSLGAEYKVDQSSALRLFVGWDNTGRFKSVSPLQAGDRSILQVKDSYSLGIGVVFRFF